jgi:nucleoside-diphosphate-sugar epimerase
MGSEKSLLTEAVFYNFKKGKSAQWFGYTDKVHSFTYTKDIGIGATTLGLSEKANGKVWHLHTADKPWTGQQIVDFTAQEMGVKPKLTAFRGFLLTILAIFIPILKEFKEMMYHYEHDYVFNSSLFEKTFGIKPTPYEIGMRKRQRFTRNKENKMMGKNTEGARRICFAPSVL